MEFDLAYKITEFREAQSGYFDENGKRYSSTPIGDEKAELMLQIINELESALIKVEEREQINNEALLEIGFTHNEKELVCEALIRLLESNRGYLELKKDDFSQKEIPKKLNRITELYQKLRA